MRKEISEKLGRARERASCWLHAVLSRAREIIKDRELLPRVGYYGALLALLALLGSLSRDYRREDVYVNPADYGAGIDAMAREITPDDEAQADSPGWVWPLVGEIVGAYSPDQPVYSRTLGQWQTHQGLDISGAAEEAVLACGDGTVLDAWEDRLCGNVIVIDHGDGYRSTYAGLNTLRLVSVGDVVCAGQVIGAVGRTAACEADLLWHLHFEMTRDGESVDFGALVSDA